MALVGIIANPASGKDIRRLTAYGSVFDNQEKVRIVRRVLLGLSAVGVDRILYMPDSYNIVNQAIDPLEISIQSSPTPFPIEGNQDDTIKAARFMEEQKADCIITLGGDGTNRVVVKGNSTVPILPISTGTNNVFPYMAEATLAGLAAGLVARRLVSRKSSIFTSTKLEVIIDEEVTDLALVDAAVYDDIFTGSRAVWEIDKVSQIFLNRAEPDSIGLSSIGGFIQPISAASPRGLYVELGKNGFLINAPIAPGLMQPVPIKEHFIMEPKKEVRVRHFPCVLALDGEREVVIQEGQNAAVRLSLEGPKVIDIKAAMAQAVKKGVFKI